MHDYEILIFGRDHKPRTIVEMIEPSDDAAIRTGLHIAHGRDIEVWRDLDLIYRTTKTAETSH